MSTLNELIDTHLPAARTRYAAACTELVAAYGDLNAIEIIVSGAGGRGAAVLGAPKFGEMPELVKLRHAVANPTFGTNWADYTNGPLATRTAAFGTADPV